MNHRLGLTSVAVDVCKTRNVSPRRKRQSFEMDDFSRTILHSWSGVCGSLRQAVGRRASELAAMAGGGVGLLRGQNGRWFVTALDGIGRRGRGAFSKAASTSSSSGAGCFARVVEVRQERSTPQARLAILLVTWPPGRPLFGRFPRQREGQKLRGLGSQADRLDDPGR